MVKTLIWLASSKQTKTRLKSLLSDVESLNLIDSVLTSYSHNKLEKIFKSQTMKILFEYFIEHSYENFLSNYEGQKLEKSKEMLGYFTTKFAQN